MHDETQTLPLTKHFKPHASQIKQKSTTPMSLHKLTKLNGTPRLMKQSAVGNIIATKKHTCKYKHHDHVTQASNQVHNALHIYNFNNV